MSRAEGRRWPLFAGGFIGPFAGNIVVTMLPELSGALGVSIAAVATTTTGYMVPFCVTLLVSIPLGGRLGELARLRLGYGLMLFGSVVCALAVVTGPGLAFAALVGGRALQGIGNALTAPVILTVLKRSVPHTRLGTALGLFAAMQAAGQAFAPLVGGAAAGVDYRLAFVLLGGMAGLLLICVPGGTGGAGGGRRLPVRGLVNRRLGGAAAAAFSAQFGLASIALLAALIATDRFGLSPSERGLVVASMGFAGLASGVLSGRLADRWGVHRLAPAAFLLLGCAVMLVGLSGAVWVLVAVTALGGMFGTAARVTTNQRALTSTPRNATGAMSFTLAVQFLGPATVPALLPVYEVDVLAACAIPLAVAVLGATMGKEVRA